MIRNEEIHKQNAAKTIKQYEDIKTKRKGLQEMLFKREEYKQNMKVCIHLF